MDSCYYTVNGCISANYLLRCDVSGPCKILISKLLTKTTIQTILFCRTIRNLKKYFTVYINNTYFWDNSFNQINLKFAMSKQFGM